MGLLVGAEHYEEQQCETGEQKAEWIAPEAITIYNPLHLAMIRDGDYLKTEQYISLIWLFHFICGRIPWALARANISALTSQNSLNNSPSNCKHPKANCPCRGSDLILFEITSNRPNGLGCVLRIRTFCTSRSRDNRGSSIPLLPVSNMRTNRSKYSMLYRNEKAPIQIGRLNSNWSLTAWYSRTLFIALKIPRMSASYSRGCQTWKFSIFSSVGLG